MEYRIALPFDLPDILRIYRSAIRQMDDRGIHQWDEVYPSENTLSDDIAREEMFCGSLDGRIAAVFTLNTRQDGEYKTGLWQYGNLRYAVVHRLCVDPAHQNRGIGAQSMEYAENALRSGGIEAVRLDAFSQNAAALKLYEKLGYEKVGEVTFRKGLFYLFEKKL